MSNVNAFSSYAIDSKSSGSSAVNLARSNVKLRSGRSIFEGFGREYCLPFEKVGDGLEGADDTEMAVLLVLAAEGLSDTSILLGINVPYGSHI